MEVRQAILEIAEIRNTFKTSDVVRRLGGKISRQHVSVFVRQLVKEGQLIKSGSTAGATYALPKHAEKLNQVVKRRLLREGLKEHEVLDAISRHTPFITTLGDTVHSIFDYAFSEMLNNAIEHSESKYVEIEVATDRKSVMFVVDDFGIGVFRSVMRKRGLNSELAAIQDLLKGKTTTKPHAHSGEGIFFTSKVGDIFTLESFGYRLRVDNLIPDVFVEEVKPAKKGTRVTFTLSTESSKHLNDVFKKYQTDPTTHAFDKTEIHVRLYTQGTIYVSRSQARRILEGLEKFQLIVLDFDRVPTVGQAFADEIFRVFLSKYPKIKIQSINMNEAVRFMVERVEKLK